MVSGTNCLAVICTAYFLQAEAFRKSTMGTEKVLINQDDQAYKLASDCCSAIRLHT